MAETANQQNDDGDSGVNYLGLIVTAIAIALLAVFWWVSSWWADGILAFYILEVVVISIVIWQACDPFADAAQWTGRKLHIPGSVRGATLDAVASSLPELFTGIFFVMIVASTSVEGDSKIAEGYSSTVATCAGSAIYNMILIPAIVALVISFRRKARPTVDIEDKVIARDGIAFLLCETVLILCLFMNQLYWWMGLILVGMYVVYIMLLYGDWKRFEKIKHAFIDVGLQTEAKQVQSQFTKAGIRFSLPLIQQVQDELQRGNNNEEDEDEDEQAGVFFGFWQVPLNGITTWLILIISTITAAAACYFLVQVTHDSAEYLGVPIFFVAVILAAAASSVPDTFLSIGAAMRGDDSGAVSNAFGSNIFDICICLSVPLFIASYYNSWEPISLLQDGKPMVGLVGLRILLGILTVITLGIMWHNRQLTRTKAFMLCGLYCVFIAYAVLGSLKYIDV